ncbi:MAG: slipin family protein [Candidatus Cloacimonetes bacterium]|nr:slipin family protein [Candidatus Cloacimonadota bacterium]MCF8012752.1 slipin family protein [Candidatus Woesearchaeota archaeon]
MIITITLTIIAIVIILLLITGLKVVNEYERGIKFTFGAYSGMMQPGLRFVFPIIQFWQKVDIRTTVVDVPDQDTITKDNVTVQVNAVLYYSVVDTKKAVLEVQDYVYATSQLAQTTMRDVVGEASLDEVLSKRDIIGARIKQIVDKETDPWGIKIEGVELKHIELPSDMKRVMAKEAEAEREKRAVIIKAEGEIDAAKNLAKAAHKLSMIPGSMHIRTLHSIDDLSSDKSNTTIYAVPTELLRMIERIGK